MCDQCERIDEKLTRYRFMMRWLNDERAQKGLAELIEQNEAKKRQLHPEPPQE
jgi:hypothetical protein